MRVTKQSLVRIAKERTQELVYNDQTIVAVYLTGSLVGDADPLLGGTADIDMVLVHSTQPGPTRQIVKLTPDFHLDIRHRSSAEFKSPRQLRIDPLMAWEMYDPMLLYEREKFFEFLQAGLRAGYEFSAPATVLARCRSLYSNARRTWMELSELDTGKAGVKEVALFLDGVGNAANAVAELSGAPLAERRLLNEFPARAIAAEHPEFTGMLFNLLWANQVNAAALTDWLEPWRTTFLAAAERGAADSGIHAARLNYYEKAIRAMLEGDLPLGGLWPLIVTWTSAAGLIDEPLRSSWGDACVQLGLLGPALASHISDLDRFLDEILAKLDEVAAANGLEASASL